MRRVKCWPLVRNLTGHAVCVGDCQVTRRVTTPAKELRSWGLVWIILGPVLFLMAALSKTTSDLSFFLQLALFSLVAVAGLLFGVAAVLGQAWSVTGLFTISAVVAVYFLGLGILGLVSPVRVGLILRIGMASFVAAWGLPFLYMANSIRSLARDSTVPSSTP
jgi:hypothetical protein